MKNQTKVDVMPTVTNDPGGETVETHPAYAAIRASRTSQGPRGALLFASDFRHRHYVTIEIMQAKRHRNLSNDWIYPSIRSLIKVSLTEAQWATFVSSLNVGEGVPCTLGRLGDESIPYIAALVDRREQFTAELAGKLDAVKLALVDLGLEINSASLSAKKKERLNGLLHQAALNLASNLDFVSEQFGEHMEATVERAKAEIHAHLGAAINRAGLKTLTAGGDLPTPALPMLTGGIDPDGEAR